MKIRIGMVAAIALGALATQPAVAKGPRYEATITRTTYGIPHITAPNWAGLGYGTAYAYAQDNLCLLAEEFVTIAGERSRWFGPAEKATLGFSQVDNLSSDIFFRGAIDLPALRRTIVAQPQAVRDLVRGYVAGYNRALRDKGARGLPEACRGKGWVRPITFDDMLRLNEKQMLLASSLNFAPAIANAAPPGAPVRASMRMRALPALDQQGVGSNGWAFGGEVTASGRSIVVGNPHFPWTGPSRFWEMHQTIPGEYDAMGVGLAGTPIVSLGFNRDVAWTHTVTEARHFTLYQLTLDPNDPTAYLIDGRREAMGRKTVTVPMPDGTPAVTRTLYTTRYGPVVTAPNLFLPWSDKIAFALADANRGNQRGIATWMAIGKAKTVADIRDAVSGSLGIPWVNTIAADRNGDVLHADVTAVPNVSAARIAACSTPATAIFAARVTLLDGSKAACAWERVAGTPEPGLMPARDQAIYERRDYVANSNDSYWLSNASAPYRQLSPILGAWGTQRSLRTRSGLIELARRLDGSDGLAGDGKVTQALAERMAFANKSLAAELVMPGLLKLCGTRTEIADACAALRGWDQRFDNDSRGAYLFHVFWEKARSISGLWSVPFDAADPVHTPRGLVTTGEPADELVKALAEAAAAVKAKGLALDVAWGQVQFAMRNVDRIPVHGAEGSLGVLNVQMSREVEGGLTPYHGSSYVQVVTFDDEGPVANAVLSYSQSTDPASPHFGDQTRAYAAKRFRRLPFRAAAVRADAIAQAYTISE